MKKIFTFIISAIMMFSLAGCGTNTQTSTNETSAPTSAPTEESTASPTSNNASTTDSTKALIVYFSHSGNTKKIAQKIQQYTGGELFEIQPETPYSSDYNTVLDEAKNEQTEKARPKIKEQLTGIENYDTVYLGYPIWWGDAPMIIYSFLDEYDLSGKTVMPFCTSGGSGLSGTDKSIAQNETGADVQTGLAISDSSLDNSDEEIENWIKK